jgi:cell wall-associated NlpC family hydrolase
MSVLIGSARISENGTVQGSAAGDQTGKEVATQNWYLHTKGWILLRPKEEYREKIAVAMERACANRHIGYCQTHRGTLYSAAKAVGFDPSQVTTDVETDCSALVRVCCAYAGISLDNFTTATESSVLINSGKFERLTDSKYTTSSAYLVRGDILVTKTSGHTVVVLSNGEKITATTAVQETEGFNVATLNLIKNGSTGSQVRTLQILLNGKNSAGLTVDGDCGNKTTAAIKAYQSKNGLTADGECGPKTWAKILGVG